MAPYRVVSNLSEDLRRLERLIAAANDFIFFTQIYGFLVLSGLMSYI